MFDPHAALLRNFSKHKFKSFLSEFILKPERHGYIPLGYLGKANTDQWDSADHAHIDFPSVNLNADNTPITNGFRWMFHLHHIEDGFIRKSAVREFIAERTLTIARKLAASPDYLRQLHALVTNRTLRPWHDGNVMIYLLTNMDATIGGRGWYDFLNRSNQAVQSVIEESATELGIRFTNLGDFGIGVGNPATFVQRPEERVVAVKIIEELERRPDSLNIQFETGRVRVFCSNTRHLSVFDQQDPKPALIDEVIDGSSYFTGQEIEEFEYLLNDSNVKEEKLQAFFSAHPHFLLGTDYDELRPHIALVSESNASDMIPDFFVKPVSRQLWDIVELKLPTVRLVSGATSRESLSACVRRGISQLTNYAEFFNQPTNRDRVRRATGIDVFKPRLTLVIGKRQNVDDELWNRLIDHERPIVNIVGFDDLLRRALRMRGPQRMKS